MEGAQQAKLTHLERVVAEQQEEMGRLRATVASAVTADAHARVKAHADQLEQQLGTAQGEATKLRHHLEKVETELAGYESAAARGQYNASTTKVLHMSMNPTAAAARQRLVDKALAQAREETEALRLQVRQLQDQQGTAAEPQPAAAAAAAIAEAADAKLVNQRFKEMFKKNIDQLREAVYRLLGFKVDLLVGSKHDYRVKLRSMYAENEDDCLLFHMNKEGAIDLLDSPFARNLSANLCVGLNVYGSFPVFLGDVTRHLFEQTTHC